LPPGDLVRYPTENLQEKWKKKFTINNNEQ